MFGQTNVLFQPKNNDKHELSVPKANVIAPTVFNNDITQDNRHFRFEQLLNENIKVSLYLLNIMVKKEA